MDSRESNDFSGIAAHRLDEAKRRVKILEDYTAAPVVNADYLKQHPELEALLKPLAERLDDATMRRLNARVDVDRETPAVVAADFLRQEKLLGEGN